MAARRDHGTGHSRPRGVSTYSGQRYPIGALKLAGSRGATHLEPPTPPPVRSRDSARAFSSKLGSLNRSTTVVAITAEALLHIGSIQAGTPPIACRTHSG